MTSTVLVEHPWIPTAALLVLVLAGPPAGAWLATRPQVARPLAVAVAAGAVLLTTLPVDREVLDQCVVEWAWPTPARVEPAANVVLAVAPVLLAVVVVRRPAVVLPVAVASAAAIELLQLVVPALGRSCTTTDWLANAVGAVLGTVLGLLARRRAAGRAGGRPTRTAAARRVTRAGRGGQRRAGGARLRADPPDPRRRAARGPRRR